MVIAVGFRMVPVIRLFRIGVLCIGFRLCFGGGDWASTRYVVLVIRGIDVTMVIVHCHRVVFYFFCFVCISVHIHGGWLSGYSLLFLADCLW